MVGSVDVVGAGSQAVPYRAVLVAAQQAPQTASFSSAVSSTPSVAETATGVSSNPRTVQDPSAGIITQFLSANGSQVVYQYPSAITVAYLRQGLTAEGTAKTPAYQSVGTTV